MKAKDAGVVLGYRPSYAQRKIRELLPVFRLPGGPCGASGPLVVKLEDFRKLVDEIEAEPA
jgi:hypothetical protein